MAVAKKAQSASTGHLPSMRKTWLLVFAATACLIITTSAVWFNRYIFKTSNFTTITTSSILSESSREAMASEISDKLLQNKPTLQSILDDRLTKLISALLDTDLNKRVVDKTVSTLHTTITSKSPQPVAIDLSGIKDSITKVVTVFREQTNRDPADFKINLDDIPSQIVLLDPAKLPNIYDTGTAIMWLGVVTFLVGWGLIAYLLYAVRKNKQRIKQTLYVSGGVMFIGSLIGFALGPLFKPTVMAQINSSNLRVVVENIYNSFTSKFDQVDLWMLVIPSLVLLVLALGYQLWPLFIEHRKKSRA